jgi:hypothetical protein
MQYAYGPNFVSALFLCNYWLEYKETFKEPSVLTGDRHMVALFRSDPSTQLLPFISYAACIQNNNRFCAISLQLLDWFQEKFEETINTNWRCAYHHLVLVRPFKTELWPLICFTLFIYSKNRFRAISLQGLAEIQRKFIGTEMCISSPCFYCLSHDKYINK